MNEIKVVHDERAQYEEHLDATAPKGEIRVLESFELVLAGGGEADQNWPR
jgi:hypothetical protein